MTILLTLSKVLQGIDLSSKLVDEVTCLHRDSALKLIIEQYENHPSIQSIKYNIPPSAEKFKFQSATRDSVSEILRTLNKSSSVGFVKVLQKLISLGVEIISRPLSDVINETLIDETIFSSSEKVVSVTPVFKKVDRLKKENYRPISVLNVFSEVFERFILNQMNPYLSDMLSVFLSAYRQQYSCQNVLLRLIEMWRKCLDDNKDVRAVLMDLSEAFDCLLHDLLISKLEAYCIIPNRTQTVHQK